MDNLDPYGLVLVAISVGEVADDEPSTCAGTSVALDSRVIVAESATCTKLSSILIQMYASQKCRREVVFIDAFCKDMGAWRDEWEAFSVCG